MRPRFYWRQNAPDTIANASYLKCIDSLECICTFDFTAFMELLNAIAGSGIERRTLSCLGETNIMDTPDHYRAYAEECLGWARTAKTDREREIFIEMARTWLKAAARFEGDVPWMVAPFPAGAG